MCFSARGMINEHAPTCKKNFVCFIAARQAAYALRLFLTFVLLLGVVVRNMASDGLESLLLASSFL